ncbi:hypothetical protein [Algibacter sp. L1A34]|uniref:hypothetical protein n=1 Tax=Algibacter sp. L1A34 TaxID=2686365 RepID=UPI00131B9835|nr:hypothetical protein [Algibacter sp. L1A34]
MDLIILAGFPAIKTSSKKILVTTEPTPNTKLYPITTPRQIVIFQPIQMLLPVFML